MAAAIHDANAIASRRYEIFGSMPQQSTWHDYECKGTPRRHCGVCPKADDEICHLQCETVRGAIKDGITVT
jgi:hypothetical protein